MNLENAPLVGIVILNWNNAPDTLACLDSVLALEYSRHHVLVVDNGSTDDSVRIIRAQYPQIDLLQLDCNFGYAEGNNRGIQHALSHGAEYVLILNNDVCVAPNALAALMQVMTAHPQAGIVGPCVYCVDPPRTLFAAGSSIDWVAGALHHRGMFCPADVVTLPTRTERVDFIIGCAMLVSRALIERVGLLDAAYYLNYEDVEWGVRAARRGFESWFVPQARVWHKVSATLGLASPANTYYMTRNSLRFFAMNTPVSLRALTISRIVLRTLRTVCAWSFKAQYRSDVFRRKRDANLYALRDFCLRRVGRMGADVARVCFDR